MRVRPAFPLLVTGAIAIPLGLLTNTADLIMLGAPAGLLGIAVHAWPRLRASGRELDRSELAERLDRAESELERATSELQQAQAIQDFDRKLAEGPTRTVDS